MCNRNNRNIITAVDLYITRAGRIAFLDAMHERGAGKKAFSGYVYTRVSGRDISKRLEWLPCGTCISSDNEGDQIIDRV